MYVGDRSGTIYRIPEPALHEPFATLEASVAAYHMAFGPDGKLYVTAPGLASHDTVYAIDENGSVEKYFRGSASAGARIRHGRESCMPPHAIAESTASSHSEKAASRRALRRGK
jgi:hypothetical protein